MKWETFYEVLNLRNLATEDEVRRAFSEILESLESDHMTYFLLSKEEKEKIIYQVRCAYEVLTDEASKRLYDEYLIKSRRGFLKVELTQKKGVPPEEKKEKPVNPGALLRKVREEKGYSLEDVYYAIRIAVSVLKALEEMNVEKLPEWIYLQGLLKQYAKFLNVNAEKVIEGYKKYLERDKS